MSKKEKRPAFEKATAPKSMTNDILQYLIEEPMFSGIFVTDIRSLSSQKKTSPEENLVAIFTRWHVFEWGYLQKFSHNHIRKD